ncbi:MAG: WecB/TagA/CpsF family glycosyltransferase [Anaerolineae bacterium]|nr:WecB/TagA/CpsF family glycosyltransferase [Anaerolineae bacterium]MCO5187599.1 WecB/TagA/CpsF family glycosyltransferase [Anaerolineae bacterium]MCO5193496.1 WecB/TagA/CpsF family glycosyltransferase [Anaerolineae bacterium]MCO5197389.1 WecB/TagA/CpsF family glycosyltransferase [Anaerolineae bacterium]
MMQPVRTVNILGVPIHAVTTEETLALVDAYMQEPHLHQLATVNPEFVMTAQTDAAFRAVLHSADLCLPDGIGLLYAARWLHTPLPQRVPGSDLIYDLAERCARHGWRLFLLGAAPGVAAAAGTVLQARYPGLVIAGSYAGSPAPAENDAIVARINAVSADMLFVAYGAPNQDKWIARNRAALSTVRVAIGVGGALDFVTGKAIRAPKQVQMVHLEWLYRLLREPWRWRRMLALPRFVLKVVFSRSS